MICSCITSICVTIWWKSHCLNVQWLKKKLFVRLFQILQKKKKRLKNSDIKTFERPKNIKELDDSLLRNYWNKTKYVWLNNGEI